MAMVDEQSFKSAITELRDVLHAYKTGDPRLEAMKFVLAGYESVIDRYQKVFSAENVCVLSEDEFRGFLLYKNNQHWIGLHRLGPGICKDMKKLGEALGILLDESQPIRVRLNKLAPSRGKKLVPRLGKAVLTPILLVAHPTSYGVWNSVSESAMKALSIWPSLDRGAGLGDKYELINSVILRVANALETDLWTLDSLWWALLRLREGSEDAGLEDSLSVETIPATVDAPRFGLERHLHDFLRDNWTHTELGTQWYLYEEDGEEIGYEFPTEVGRIDLLAKHKSEDRWLVVELKRDQSSDKTVGQVLRYMGWVRRNLATKDEKVEGLVVAHRADKQIQYALDMVSGITLMLYTVDFSLRISE